MLFLSAALSLLSALVRRERRQLVLTARDRRKKVRVAPRKIAASLAFATLFFAGAALSAGAGNGVVQLIDPANPSAAGDTTTTTTTTTSTTASSLGDPQDPNASRPPVDQQPSAGQSDQAPASEPQSSQPRAKRLAGFVAHRLSAHTTAICSAAISKLYASKLLTNAGVARSLLALTGCIGLRLIRMPER